jgi:hypothetical protein
MRDKNLAASEIGRGRKVDKVYVGVLGNWYSIEVG